MKKILFILITLSLLSCKKEKSEPDFNIVGQWQVMGLLAYQFNSNGTVGQSNLVLWSIAKLEHPYYQLILKQGNKVDKEVVRVINPDKFEFVGISYKYERIK